MISVISSACYNGRKPKQERPGCISFSQKQPFEVCATFIDLGSSCEGSGGGIFLKFLSTDAIRVKLDNPQKRETASAFDL